MRPAVPPGLDQDHTPPRDFSTGAAGKVIAGSCVRVHEVGLLLSGESGTGKSDAALALLDRGHSLVADDAVGVYRRGDRLWAMAPPALSGLLAIRGLGVLDAAALFGPQAVLAAAAIDLVVHLQRGAPGPVDPLAVAWRSRTIMAVRLPRLSLCVGDSRDLPLLLETVARIHRQKRLGLAPQAAFIARQRRELARGAS